MTWVWSLVLPLAVPVAGGIPCRSTSRVFRPFFQAVDGAGLLAAAEGARHDAVDGDQVGVELVGLPQHAEQVGM